MRNMTIEQALTWAYTKELPKASAHVPGEAGVASSWGAVSAFGALMTTIDASPPVNGFGCVIDFSSEMGPHPDAYAIADAVSGLDEAELGDLPEGWNPLGDFGSLGAVGDALLVSAIGRGAERLFTGEGEERRLRQPLSRLVATYASLGREPDWRGERPEAREVTGPKGAPRWFRKALVPNRSGGADEAEVDGFDERRRRPYPNAYRKHFLDPDPAPLVTARGEWELWRAGLDVLFGELSRPGALTSIEVSPSAAPWRPWEGDERRAPRVLRARVAAGEGILRESTGKARGRPRRTARAS